MAWETSCGTYNNLKKYSRNLDLSIGSGLSFYQENYRDFPMEKEYGNNNRICCCKAMIAYMGFVPAISLAITYIIKKKLGKSKG